MAPALPISMTVQACMSVTAYLRLQGMLPEATPSPRVQAAVAAVVFAWHGCMADPVMRRRPLPPPTLAPQSRAWDALPPALPP